MVTGGAGYIGSVATQSLLDAGHQVCVFDNLEIGHAEALDNRAEFEPGDLRQAGVIEKAMQRFSPEAVMHFAAYALVGESMQDPGRYFTNNLSGGINLLQAMRKCGARRIVFSSTCAVYGYPGQVPMDETTPASPVNPYGESKLALERIMDWYRRCYEFSPVFLRYFNACGATGLLGEDHAPETHLIPLVLQVAMGRRPGIDVFGDDFATPDGTCIRDYIHVKDLARAHLAALTVSYCGPLNLGTGRGSSVMEVIKCAREVTGHPIPARMAPRRPGDPPELVAATGRAREILGFSAENSELPTIIADAWAWHRAHPTGYGNS